MPNTLAQLVLLSWPFMTWILFSRLRVTLALPATILLGYLFIPERVGWKLPMLPALDKSMMPSLCALVAVSVVMGRERVAALRAARRAALDAPQEPGGAEPAPGRRAPRGGARSAVRTRIALLVPLISAVVLVAPALTWVTNQTPLVYGWRVIPGLRPYDIGSMLIGLGIIFLPLYLARRHLRSREAQLDLAKVFVYSGLIYSLLVLWEARMSPQLNIRLYGFFAHSFMQHVRGGAYRPIVFLGHGLLVGVFLALTVLSAAVLARNNTDGRRKIWLGALVWLLFTLVFSRNLGSTMIALLLVPVILFTSARIQFSVAMLVAVLVLAYPLARGSGVIPAERISGAIAVFSVERASSLDFRLRNEDILLEKANEKPLAGWGPWGRSRIFNEAGRDISIADGAWIIIIGVYGWTGYLGQFGLLCLPMVFAWMRRRQYGLEPVDAGMMLVLCGNLVDLIPNASMVPVLWVLAGAAWGRLEDASTTKPETRLSRARSGRGARPERRSADQPGSRKLAPS